MEGLRRFSRSRLGKEGFLFSLIFHAILVLGAIFWIAGTITPKKAVSEEQSVFDGPGGGRGGASPELLRASPPLAPKAQAMARLVSKGDSPTTLPDFVSQASAFSAAGASDLAGALSSGDGDGAGGGNGPGNGPGSSSFKNFSTFFGAKIQASKVALYMDCSSSMLPYLDRVEAEAKKSFPSADVFRIFGVFVIVEDGEVQYGLTPRRSYKTVVSMPTSGQAVPKNDPRQFSPAGKSLLEKHLKDFRKGSVGSFFELAAKSGGYDTIIIFSDFQDGVDQFEKGVEIAHLRAETTEDNRTPAQKAWELRWVDLVTQKKSPKVYLYTTEVEPQPFWQNVAKASRGGVVDMRWIVTGSPPPESRATEPESLDRQPR